jgi:hypothetical protein
MQSSVWSFWRPGLLAGTCPSYNSRVSYDISLMRPQAGRTLLETLTAAYAKLDVKGKREPLTPEQRAPWDRIVERVTRELGPASCEDFASALVLRREGPPAVRLRYEGTRADVEIPYRYSGDLALPSITQAYHIATIVEQETGLTGYDLQAYQPVADGDLELAAAKLGETTLLARESLARRGLSPEDVW